MEKHRKASGIQNKTQDHLMRAAKEMGHSIEKRINKIKIGANENFFISFVLSDIFPDKFTDGEIIGFVDISGYGDRLPDGQYSVKLCLDEKNLNKPSEFINVETGKQYLFDTDTEKIEESDTINTSEFMFSVQEEECIWIVVDIPYPDGTIVRLTICMNCPDCSN